MSQIKSLSVCLKRYFCSSFCMVVKRDILLRDGKTRRSGKCVDERGIWQAYSPGVGMFTRRKSVELWRGDVHKEEKRTVGEGGCSQGGKAYSWGGGMFTRRNFVVWIVQWKRWSRHLGIRNDRGILVDKPVGKLSLEIEKQMGRKYEHDLREIVCEVDGTGLGSCAVARCTLSYSSAAPQFERLS
jgi:hypothetical protein